MVAYRSIGLVLVGVAFGEPGEGDAVFTEIEDTLRQRDSTMFAALLLSVKKSRSWTRIGLIRGLLFKTGDAGDVEGDD